jgi:hypothetical protein
MIRGVIRCAEIVRNNARQRAALDPVRNSLTGARACGRLYYDAGAKSGGRYAMAIIESTPRRLVLKSGATTLTLDKDVGKASLQRKLLMWNRKPVEQPLSQIVDVTVDAAVDRASGVEVCSTMLVSRAGGAWAVSAADLKEAAATAQRLREFLGLPT